MEPKTLTNFMNTLKTKGIRKKNQFQIVVTTGYSDIDKALEDMTIWVNNSELPSRTQEFTEVKYQAYPFQLPTVMTMTQEHTMTVKSDSDGELRRAFLKWMSYTSNPAFSDGSVGEGDKKIPTAGNVRILLYKDDMKTVSEIYKLVGVAVQEVGALELSNEDAEIATFDIILKSQYWENEEANTGNITDIR